MDTPTPVAGTVIPKFDPKDIEDNKLFAALSYVSILSIVVLIMKKDSKYAQEHAKQGTVLFGFEIAVYILGLLPFFGWFIIAPIGNILAIIATVVGFLKAINGEFWEIPVIGPYRNKVNF